MMWLFPISFIVLVAVLTCITVYFHGHAWVASNPREELFPGGETTERLSCVVLFFVLVGVAYILRTILVLIL